MKVYLKPLYGDTYSNTDRAKVQLTKALEFRGSITHIVADDGHIMAEIEINPQWDLSAREKVKYLRDWLPTRVHHFEVNFS